MREGINVKGADIELDFWLISILCPQSQVKSIRPVRLFMCLGPVVQKMISLNLD